MKAITATKLLGEIAVLLTATLIATPSSAQADGGCVFNTNQAIVCSYPESAAIAFNEFGFDGSAATSYNNVLLHRAGCGGIPGGWDANKNLKVDRSGRVPTRRGWINVAWLQLSDGFAYWTASDYLTPKCFPHR